MSVHETPARHRHSTALPEHVVGSRAAWEEHVGDPEVERDRLRALLEEFHNFAVAPEIHSEAIAEANRTLLRSTTTPLKVVGATISYEILPTINIDSIIGATTVVPTDQHMLDVYSLLKPLLFGRLIGTSEFPMPIGGNDEHRIVWVEQNSPEDIALACFPTFVRRIS